ncbi:MAG: DUF2125 domain-containing protein [Paracoccaceae bacterium]|nr:DUF2125 domain-containing protein [Paracoccaceae bacterium]
MSRAFCPSALALLLASTAAMADVTPAEVWDSWQAMATAAGQELTIGGTAQAGDTLEVTDLVMTYQDQLGGSASVSFDKLAFRDNGDGTVTITLPESYPLAMAFPATDDGPGSLKLTVRQPGLAIVAGGSATETSYDFTAPTVQVVLDEITDETGKILDTQGELTLTDATARYLVSRNGDQTVLDSSFAAKGVALNIAGKDDETDTDGKIVLSLADVSGVTKGNFLNAEIMANLAAALNSGFTMDSSLSFGAATLDFDLTEPAGPTKLVAAATGGSFVLAMDKVRLTYGSSLDGARFTLSSYDIPFPQVELAFAESGFNLMMPTTRSDTPQDFALLTKLEDFTVSEDLWGLFDPAGSLSREPATFVLDTKGTGFWTTDIMDPSVDLESVEAPGEVHSLDLTQLLARAAGAEVSASGGVTFDNSDLTTFGGVPRPDGTFTVNIKGVNKLIENLIALGILTDDDAMGFRMGLAMFARPGAGPDELISEIEFRDGGIFANGQQLL